MNKNLKDLTLENKLLDFVEEDLIKAIQNVLNNIEKNMNLSYQIIPI